MEAQALRDVEWLRCSCCNRWRIVSECEARRIGGDAVACSELGRSCVEEDDVEPEDVDKPWDLEPMAHLGSDLARLVHDRTTGLRASGRQQPPKSTKGAAHVAERASEGRPDEPLLALPTASSMATGHEASSEHAFPRHRPRRLCTSRTIDYTATVLDRQLQDVVTQHEGEDANDDHCGICGQGGSLLCCDGRCRRAFHLSCIGMRERDVPRNDWFCDQCRKGYRHPRTVDGSAADAKKAGGET